MNTPPIPVLVRQIVAFNQAWKQARKRWGAEHAITLALRERKTALQLDLLHHHRHTVFLRRDTEADGEALFSVRLLQSVRLPNGHVRVDAEHLPERLALQFLSETEIESLMEPAS